MPSGIAKRRRDHSNRLCFRVRMPFYHCDMHDDVVVDEMLECILRDRPKEAPAAGTRSGHTSASVYVVPDDYDEAVDLSLIGRWIELALRRAGVLRKGAVLTGLSLDVRRIVSAGERKAYRQLTGSRKHGRIVLDVDICRSRQDGIPTLPGTIMNRYAEIARVHLRRVPPNFDGAMLAIMRAYAMYICHFDAEVHGSFMAMEDELAPVDPDDTAHVQSCREMVDALRQADIHSLRELFARPPHGDPLIRRAQLLVRSVLYGASEVLDAETETETKAQAHGTRGHETLSS